jgi:hypothetical protein
MVRLLILAKGYLQKGARLRNQITAELLHLLSRVRTISEWQQNSRVRNICSPRICVLQMLVF